VTDYDVVVIGAGAAGLSAGALLATVEPPLEGAGSGFHDFIPTEIGRQEALRIVDAIPAEVVPSAR
jgi:hypothetical protein